MKITEVSYKKLKSLGNFQNETVGARALVEEGDSPEATYTVLRQFVEDCLDRPDAAKVSFAKNVQAAPDNYTGKQVKEAAEILARATRLGIDATDSIPF